MNVPSWIISPECRVLLSIPVGQRTPAQSVNAWVEEWQAKAREWERFGDRHVSSAAVCEERIRFCMEQADQVLVEATSGRWGRI